METLKMEFELATEANAKLAQFNDELTVKFNGMALTKQTWMKFAITMDKFVKSEALTGITIWLTGSSP